MKSMSSGALHFGASKSLKLLTQGIHSDLLPVRRLGRMPDKSRFEMFCEYKINLISWVR